MRITISVGRFLIMDLTLFTTVANETESEPVGDEEPEPTAFSHHTAATQACVESLWAQPALPGCSDPAWWYEDQLNASQDPISVGFIPS